MIEVLVNQAATPRFKTRIEAVLRNHPDFDIKSLNFPVQITPERDGFVVVGGDGSVNAVIGALRRIGSNAGVFVAGGGTHNSFYRSLLDSEAVVTDPDQLITGDFKSIDHFPGMVNQETFLNLVEYNLFGNPEIGRKYKDIAPILRKLGHRSLIWQTALFYSLAANLKNLRPEAITPKIVLTNSFMGKRKIFNEISLDSRDLYHATFETEDSISGLRKLGLSFVLLALGIRPSPELMRVEAVKELIVSGNSGQTYYANGEVESTTEQNLRFRRSDWSVKVAAFDPT